MHISSFNDLLSAALQQPEPQRLLFVFAGAELADDMTAAQREQFLAGQGGALVPLMCVDRLPSELENFKQLEEESLQFGQDWAMVFVAGLSGRQGMAPTSEQAQPVLERMVASIKAGDFGAYMPFDRMGDPVVFG